MPSYPCRLGVLGDGGQVSSFLQVLSHRLACGSQSSDFSPPPASKGRLLLEAVPGHKHVPLLGLPLRAEPVSPSCFACWLLLSLFPRCHLLQEDCQDLVVPLLPAHPDCSSPTDCMHAPLSSICHPPNGGGYLPSPAGLFPAAQDGTWKHPGKSIVGMTRGLEAGATRLIACQLGLSPGIKLSGP